MIDKLLTKTKKAILLSTASVFVLMAASNAYKEEQGSYILQGASQQTITSLVQQVGGEIIHDFSVISAVSASLTQSQVDELKNTNSMLRFDKKDQNKVAAFVWPKRDKKSGPNSIAAFVWPKRDKKSGPESIAAFVWPKRDKKSGPDSIAAFVWPKRDKKSGPDSITALV